MGEQMKSFGKTDSSVKKLGGIGNGLADKESLWFIVGKNGKFTGNKKITVSIANIRGQYYNKHKPFSNS